VRNDISVRHDVEAELEWDPRLDARDIGVAVKDGVVALTGHVRSYAERCAAEQAVQSVIGVQAVANDIVIKLPTGDKNTDPELAAIAIAALKHDVTVPSGDIKVVLRDGWIWLEGHVEHWFQKDAAQAAVARLRGIRGVSNNLAIRCQPSQPDVHDKIREAFRRRALADSERISVSCEGGVVTLDGEVRSPQDRQRVESAVRQAPGVIQVQDNIRVVAE